MSLLPENRETEKYVAMPDDESKEGYKVINIDELVKGKHTWSFWMPLQDETDKSDGFFAAYRTNGKKVQVKFPDGTKGETSCNKTDKFNISIGIRIALGRCRKKFIDKHRTHITDQPFEDGSPYGDILDEVYDDIDNYIASQIEEIESV